MRQRRSVGLTILLVVLVWGRFTTLSAFAQQGRPQVEVIFEDHHDFSRPLRDVEPAHKHNDPPREIPLGRPHPGGPSARIAADGALKAPTSTPIATSTSAGLNVLGVGKGFVGVDANGDPATFTVDAAPPDPNGAVGATQYVQWVNESFAVFDKATGAVLHGPVPGNTLWSGFNGGGCETNNDGDPIVQYDKAADRWIFTQFSVSTTPYLQCLAVSVTSDATGSYHRYAFEMQQFPDYSKLGVWPDAYYITFNMFNGNSFTGARVCAFDRAAMLDGLAATAQCKQLSSSFASLLPSDLDGSTPPPLGAPNYLLNFGSNSLRLWRFHVDWTTPANTTLTGPTSLPVIAFTRACGGGACIPQKGTSNKLDSLGDRLMYRLAYRNFGDHEALVVNHSVAAGTTSTGKTGIRWYELRNAPGQSMSSATPIVYQQGTYSPDSNYRWMGSIAMDKAGNIAVGYSVSGTNLNPAIRYTGRAPADLAGTLQTETTIISGTGSQTRPLNRWGDYSSISVDPVDDCTFWYTNEYLESSGRFNWSTRIAAFKFGTCN